MLHKNVKLPVRVVGLLFRVLILPHFVNSAEGVQLLFHAHV